MMGRIVSVRVDKQCDERVKINEEKLKRAEDETEP